MKGHARFFQMFAVGKIAVLDVGQVKIRGLNAGRPSIFGFSAAGFALAKARSSSWTAICAPPSPVMRADGDKVRNWNVLAARHLPENLHR